LVIAIGVLELQGGFELHHNLLKKIGINSTAVKVETDFNAIDGLIIPGGESTTLSLLIEKFELKGPIVNFAKSHPVLGTCAGLILMSKKIDDERINPLGLLDLKIKRNAYGRQIKSSKKKVMCGFNQENIELVSTFIRAPKIENCGKNIDVIGKIQDCPVAVFSKNILGLSFHPEIDGIDIFHRMMFDKSSRLYYKKIKQDYAA